MRSVLAACALALVSGAGAQDAAQQNPTQQNPTQQHAPRVVFLIGEREYGSERTMPAFAERLERDLQLRTDVLTGDGQRLPELDVLDAALDSADLLVLFLRFREADDAQLERLQQWFDDGRPCVALRTTSHAFVEHKGWFPPLFGGHYKAHAPNGQGTLAMVDPRAHGHPILRGMAPRVEMGHGGTYNAQPLADSATPLVFGRTGTLPAEPIAWVNRYRPTSRLFYTSLGSRENFEREEFQTLLGNAVLWCLEREVPAKGAFGSGSERAPMLPGDISLPAPANRPDDAVVLFDGDTNVFRHWDPSVEPLAIGIDQRADTSSGGPVYDGGRWPTEHRALTARPGFGDVVTTDVYGDYHLHVDVMLPTGPDWVPDEFRGRSGIYLEGRYELEIADSAGRAPDEWSMGAIAGQRAPRVDAARPAGQWQSLDIHFRHRQDEDAVISAWLNGEQIHDRVRLREPTVYGFRRETPGARSIGTDGGLRHARAAAQSFAFGDGGFTLAARFRTEGSGTLAAKAPPRGKWARNGKTLFLRGGQLVYDIGWVGAMQSPGRYDDGRWHRVLLTHDGDTAHMFVDGERVASRQPFVAPDDPSHVFKIGATAPDFGGPFTGEISDVVVWEHRVTADKATQWTRGETVHLGDAAFEWQPTEPRSEPSARNWQAVRGPIRLQADTSAVRFANVWLRPLAEVDHRGLIAARDADVLARGARLYRAVCTECHTAPQQAFAAGLQNGDDPRAIYETLEKGFGDKQAMAWIPAGPRYAIVHFVRDQLGLPPVDDAYLQEQPAGVSSPADGAHEVVDDDDWPEYRRSDYGDVLHWTYQVADDNFAQKGIAVRVDGGPGGISRGNAFVVYDHDTMRMAAAWTGEGFIDWKGVAFDRSHNTHASIVGDVAFVNPDAPGWADPETGSFDDVRLVGRDDRRFGPLPRRWVRFLGRRQLGARTVLEYTVGSVPVRETPGCDRVFGTPVFTRSLEVGPSEQDLWLRVAPADVAVRLQADGRDVEMVTRDGSLLAHIAPGDAPLRLTARIVAGNARMLALHEALFDVDGRLPDAAAEPATRWPETIDASVLRGEADGPYAVDEFVLPDLEDNPWRSWLRLGGFDFFADGERMAVSTWNGDVFVVDGVGAETATWRRIAAGLHQPLGVRILDDVVYVGCRDQICVLEDTDGDGETDHYRCFNNDHQVTEHFHEFAMGLQSDPDGNFYYAKSARHAKPALVPHHGTLLKVSADGERTEIVANGFRAANGVCIEPDGSFFVTDQEGHWTPKNRINRVVPGGFYGNMMGYHDVASTADDAMEQPLCWLTNTFDRSPAELLRVEGDRFGLPAGALLELSYGTGRVHLVLEDEVGGRRQAGCIAMPFGPFATGVMRGRFHPGDGQLYCCGLYGWSGARTRPGGLYRVRYVGGALPMAVAMKSVGAGLQLTFGCELERELAEDPQSWSIKTWSLRRSANYGSPHLDEQPLAVGSARLGDDGRTVLLTLPSLAPTMCVSIDYDLEQRGGDVLRGSIHGTLHALAPR